MTLDEYLSKPKNNPADLSNETGLSQSSISRLRRGDQNPSYDAMVSIKEATGGKVSFKDWEPS